MTRRIQTLILLIGAVILLALVAGPLLDSAGGPQDPDVLGPAADTNALFAIICGTILAVPLFAGLLRRQHSRIHRDLRTLDLATATELTWTARNGREYAILREAGRVRVVAA